MSNLDKQASDYFDFFPEAREKVMMCDNETDIFECLEGIQEPFSLFHNLYSTEGAKALFRVAENSARNSTDVSNDMKIREIMNKDYLSDAELKYGISFLSELEFMMSQLDERFSLSTNEIRRVLKTFCGYASHRQL